MLKTKRKRAVVLALIAFFCTAATTYVAVDWKRFGGGFLAYFRGKGDATVASKPGSGIGGSGGVRVASADDVHDSGASLPRLAGSNGRKHTAEASHGAGGGHKSDEDLFKYGDPAAGGIPPGRFIVAENEGGGGAHGGEGPPAAPQVSSPAPAPEFGAPGGSNGGLNDSGLTGRASTPSSSNPPPPPPTTPVTPTPPVSGPPAGTPPADTTPPPPSDPTQAGNTDPGTPVPPSSPVPSSPVSAVPEASTTSMMALGALLLAVAASRQRKKS